jgi:hypothetical protein
MIELTRSNAARRRAAMQASQRQRRATLAALERDGLHVVLMPELSEEIAITWPTL